MMNASQSALTPGEPLAPSSLGTAAATLAACAHPQGSTLAVSGDFAAVAAAATWCAACGALHPGGGLEGAWQAPALTSGLTKKHFEDLALLLHSIVQLTQLARAHGSPGGSASSTPIFLRVRASLSELSRLPVVRDVGRLEEAIAAMPPSPVRPPSR
jgi:hypothetical protein